MSIKIPRIDKQAEELTATFGTVIQDPIPAHIGNPVTGETRVDPTSTDRDGQYYIHGLGKDLQSAYTAINNLPYAKEFFTYGLPVFVRKETNGYVISDFDHERQPTFFRSVKGVHDQVPVFLSQIFYGTLQPSPGGFTMQALVVGAVIGEDRVKDQLTADFSASPDDVNGDPIDVPTNNNRAIGVLVQVDPATNTISYKQGAEFNASLTHGQAFDAGYYPQPDSGKKRWGYVRLVAGMSAITYDHLYNAPELYETGGVLSVAATAGETLVATNAAFLDTSDGKLYKIDTNASPIKVGTIRGIISSGAATNGTATLCIFGKVSGFTALTAWGRLYASTTAGSYTQTRPTVSAGGGQLALIDLGFADTTTSMFVTSSTVKYLKRESLADAASTTITHHSDPQGRNREAKAYISSTISGASLATYASSNQDTDVNLSSKTVNTYGSNTTTGGTATADSNFGAGYEADKAFDSNNATYWLSANSALPHNLEYQHASAKTIRKYTIIAPPAAVADATMAPKTWTFEYYNGSTWIVVDTQTLVANWTANESRSYTFSSAASAANWRINTTATQNGTFASIAELQMNEVSAYTDGATKLAQSFTIASTTTVDTVKLWLKKVASPAGTMTLRIETDSAGSPSGTLANANATVTVAESSLSTSYGWITFDFATNFSLTGSTTYWLVLSTSRSTDEFNYVQWGADNSSPSYSNGQMKTYSGSWSANSMDACFEVFGEATAYDEPAVVGRWASGTRDIGVKYLDGSDLNGDVSTTFKNTNGSGTLDVTCVLELM